VYRDNTKYVRVKRIISSHEISQSGNGGDCETGNRASSMNQGGRGGTGSCDESSIVEGISRKTHAV